MTMTSTIMMMITTMIQIKNAHTKTELNSILTNKWVFTPKKFQNSFILFNKIQVNLLVIFVQKYFGTKMVVALVCKYKDKMIS